jgi:fucose 4-O-acetylase-like acetyltransferase
MSRSRIDWLDGAKGIAIFLVVLGHVLRGLPAGSGKGDDWAVFLDAWIYTFHMPVFFLLSGLFIEGSVGRPFGSFLGGKLRTIMYPYFVWSVLQEIVRSATGAASLRDVWQIAYHPVMQFWFLYVLFLLGVIYVVLRKTGLPPWAFGVLVIALYAMLQFGVSLGSWGVIYMLALNGIYFAAGALDGPVRLPERFERHRPAPLLVFSVFIFGLLVAAVAAGLQSGSWIRPVLGLLGSAATLALANALFRLGLCGFLLGWGRLSLEIFVAHTIFSAGIREVLTRLHVGSPAIHVAAGLVAGMAGPILLVAVLKRLGIGFAFSLPARRPARVGSG